MNLLRILATVSSLTMVSRVLGYVRDFFIARIFGAGLAHRRLLRRLQDPQPAAAPVRRRRVLAGLRADPGRIQEQDQPEETQVADRRSCHAALPRAGRRGCRWAWRPRRSSSTSPRPGSRPSRRSSRSRCSCCASPSRTSCSSRWSRSPPASSTPGTALQSPRSRRRCSTSRSSSARRSSPITSTRRCWCSPGRCSPAACCSSRSRCPSSSRLGLLPRWRLDFSHPGVRRVLFLMVPAAFGVSVSQISLLINQIFASFLADGQRVLALLRRPADGVARRRARRRRRHDPAAQPVEVPRRGQRDGVQPAARLGPAHHGAARRAERRSARGAGDCRSSRRCFTTAASAPRTPG